MRSGEMICENCDYYESWDSNQSVLVHLDELNGANSRWSIEIHGSCRRHPPTMMPVGQSEILPGCPFFTAVCRDYWCGEGRWTDPEDGKRYHWGDWEEY
jgi:hypothetical protein